MNERGLPRKYKFFNKYILYLFLGDIKIMILRNRKYFLLCSYFNSVLLFGVSVIKSYDIPESINPAEMFKFGTTS